MSLIRVQQKYKSKLNEHVFLFCSNDVLRKLSCDLLFGLMFICLEKQKVKFRKYFLIPYILKFSCCERSTKHCDILTTSLLHPPPLPFFPRLHLHPPLDSTFGGTLNQICPTLLYRITVRSWILFSPLCEFIRTQTFHFCESTLLRIFFLCGPNKFHNVRCYFHLDIYLNQWKPFFQELSNSALIRVH